MFERYAGIKAIQQLLLEKRISPKGIFGPLIELFTVNDDKYTTAVEVTAGGSLSHVVVDNEARPSRGTRPRSPCMPPFAPCSLRFRHVLCW